MAGPRTKARNGNPKADSAATVGYEAQLWQMADALRGSMDAAEYKHVCLGLLFLKYISDAFEEMHAALLAEKDEGADPEDLDVVKHNGHPVKPHRPVGPFLRWSTADGHPS